MKLSLFKKSIFNLIRIYFYPNDQTLFKKNDSILDFYSNFILCNFINKSINKFNSNNIKKFKEKFLKKNDFAFFIATFFTKKKEHLIYFLKSKRKYIIYDERFYKNLNFFYN